jgi:hypothetical protein
MSGWHIVMLKILPTPALNEEVEKIGDQERTGEEVRMRDTKGSSEEVEKKDDQARTGEKHPKSKCSAAISDHLSRPVKLDERSSWTNGQQSANQAILSR